MSSTQKTNINELTKFRKFIGAVLPNLFATSCFIVVTLLICLYYLITYGSARLIVAYDVRYYEVQNDIIGMIFYEQRWVLWVDRFMDFVFWGIIASVVIFFLWAVLSVLAAFNNHFTQEKFVHFNTPTVRWHENFVVIAIVKVALVVVVPYLLLALVTQAVPLLATGVSLCIQAATWRNVQLLLTGLIAVFCLQVLIFATIKTFSLIHADE